MNKHYGFGREVRSARKNVCVHSHTARTMLTILILDSKIISSRSILIR